MKIIKYLMLVTICLVICSSVASAVTSTIDPVTTWRYVAYDCNEWGTYQIGTTANDWAVQCWAAYMRAPYESYYYYTDFRTVVYFDVHALGFDSNHVDSATLNFTATMDPYIGSAVRNGLTVDQIASFNYGPNYSDMYREAIAQGVVANGELSATYSVDITAALKAAMDASTANSGIAFRFYNDNDADIDLGSGLIAPYDAVNHVVNYNTGYLFSTPTIVIESRPAYCGAAGTIYLDGDINKDCKIDFVDFALMATGWMDCTTPEDENCSGWYN